jgi:nitrite reductase/ring-hydroxylating ferredoxin subunit
MAEMGRDGGLVHLCDAVDIAEGAARGFDPLGRGRDAMFIVRRGGRLFAWFNACPHYGDTPMAWRTNAYLDADGTAIVCASHGALFDIETGLCTLGPCLGQSLTPVPLTVSEEGDVAVDPKQLEEFGPWRKTA